MLLEPVSFCHIVRGSKIGRAEMLTKDGNETVVRVAIAIGSFLLPQVWDVGK